jgi:thymidylate synthase ThyX
MGASLVWYSSSPDIFIPPTMGAPREDQLQGSQPAQLAELCGRICYDSLGTGRSSEGFHKHILEVGHGSVHEHWHMTVEITDTGFKLWPHMINRPGLFVAILPAGYRVTFNPRVFIDWNRHGTVDLLHSPIGSTLQDALALTFPEVFQPSVFAHREYPWKVVPAETADEVWISLYMQGSRGFSHEQVRHGDATAISQRSTRYVDESDSDWEWHPLLRQYLEEESDGGLQDDCLCAEVICKDLYVVIVEKLQDWLTSKGVDKLTARKQARGAARGFLGNALSTEMIFSASVRQWQWQLQNRMSDGADAEIRLIYNQVLRVLLDSPHREFFAEYGTKPAKDGIGMVLDYGDAPS